MWLTLNILYLVNVYHQLNKISKLVFAIYILGNILIQFILNIFMQHGVNLQHWNYNSGCQILVTAPFRWGSVSDPLCPFLPQTSTLLQLSSWCLQSLLVYHTTCILGSLKTAKTDVCRSGSTVAFDLPENFKARKDDVEIQLAGIIMCSLMFR